MQNKRAGDSAAIVSMQLKRLAQESGIYQWERYVDVSKNPAWEKTAEEWIVNAKDPDK